MVLIDLQGPQNESKWRFYINKKAEISKSCNLMISPDPKFCLWCTEIQIRRELQTTLPKHNLTVIIIGFFLNHCYICNVSSLIYVVLDVQLICLFFK